MEITRKDMPEHEEDLKVHLEMALETVTDLKKRLEKSLSDTMMIKTCISFVTMYNAYNSHYEKPSTFSVLDQKQLKKRRYGYY